MQQNHNIHQKLMLNVMNIKAKILTVGGLVNLENPCFFSVLVIVAYFRIGSLEFFCTCTKGKNKKILFIKTSNYYILAGVGLVDGFGTV